MNWLRMLWDWFGILIPIGGYLALACVFLDWYAERRRKQRSDKVVKQIIEDIDDFERRMGWK